MPAFADSISEGDVRWEKKVGDQVKEDDVLCEIETDKVKRKYLLSKTRKTLICVETVLLTVITFFSDFCAGALARTWRDQGDIHQ